MNSFSQVPPGFRFHPTDEELVDYYLRKKVANKKIDLNVIKDVDLYRIEPWDLEELCKIGSEEQNEWYFFSHKDKKYPTGTRTNRATKAGFWKATGRDKAIYSRHCLVGMRKTLVFYKGRAPNGQKSDWIMHEYRLETNENGTPQEEGWVVCRVFKKKLPTMRKMGEYESPCWYDEQVSFMQESPRRMPHSHPYASYQQQWPCKQELHLQYNMVPQQDVFLQLPQLESPTVPQSATSLSCNSIFPYSYERNNSGSTLQSSTITQERQMEHSLQQNLNSLYCKTITQERQMEHSLQQNLNSLYCNNDQAVDQVTDWRVLDKFVASQLSHDPDASKDTSAANAVVLHVAEQINLPSSEIKRPEITQEYGSTAGSSCPIELWKSSMN